MWMSHVTRVQELKMINNIKEPAPNTPRQTEHLKNHAAIHYSLQCKFAHAHTHTGRRFGFQEDLQSTHVKESRHTCEWVMSRIYLQILEMVHDITVSAPRNLKIRTTVLDSTPGYSYQYSVSALSPGNHCGVLRCAAVCCSVLRCILVCCSLLQCLAWVLCLCNISRYPL